VRNCLTDEGRSLEAALQGAASNCNKLLRHNGHGGERCGQKAWVDHVMYG